MLDRRRGEVRVWGMRKFAVVLSLISLVLNVSASTQPSLKVKKLGVSFPQRDPTQSVYEFVSYAGNRGSDMFRIRFEELKDDIFSNFELGLSSDHGRSWSDVERWKAAPPGPDDGCGDCSFTAVSSIQKMAAWC